MQSRALFSITALAAAIIVSAAPAVAASPLSAMAVGSTAKYRVSTQTNSPQTGAQSMTYNVVFKRVSESSIKVRVDGAKALTLNVGSDGSIEMPQSDPNPALQPFLEMGSYFKGAPSPIAAGNTWTAVVPVQVAGQTKSVSVTFKASELQENVLNVAGTGSDTINVATGQRTREAALSVNASVTYGASHTLTSANSTKTATVTGGGKKAKNAGKNGQYGSSWTITPM